MKHLLSTTAAVAVLALSSQAGAVPVTGLTASNQLVSFDTAAPGAITSTRGVTGLQAGETLLGIDYRPATSQLYGVGSTGRLYTIGDTGAATFAATLPVSPSGASFGVAFNPVVDRLRVNGDSDQNLRINVDTGETIVDGALAYAAGDANAGRDPNVVAAAYTNQVSGTVAATTLYDIDAATDSLVTQNPANAGTLNTVGALGIDARAVAGFDIAGDTGVGYASLSVGAGGPSTSGLYRIDLGTGAATLLGAIGTAGITGIALVPATAVPEPASAALFGAGLLGLFAARRRHGAP